MNFKNRFGNFLITIGAGLTMLFFLSDYVQLVQGWYLLIGVILLGLGITLKRQGREAPEESGRFRLLKSLGRGKKSGKKSKDKKEDEDE